jgi:membrane protease YdiL (CAAX protease family)
MAPAPSNVNLSLDAPMTKPVSDTIKFFLLTYAVTWVCWIPVVTNRIPYGTFFGSTLWIVGAFGPSLVSLALTARKQGGAGVRALLEHVLRWQVGARWYLFAIGYMIAIKLTLALAYRAIIGHWPPFGHEGPVVMLVATLISTPVQAGEEIGWRGYALPRLGSRFGFGSGSVMLGLIWACWHVPQFFLMAADTYGQSFPIWAVEVIAMSVAIAWLYTHTQGSLLLTMLMHAAINNTKDIVPAGLANARNAFSLHASPVTYLGAVVLWIAAAYFLRRMPERSLGHPASASDSSGQELAGR